jgi:hypothetical protein
MEKILWWILAAFFSLFIVSATGYGLYLLGGIGLLVILPIVAFIDYGLLKKLGIIK